MKSMHQPRARRIERTLAMRREHPDGNYFGFENRYVARDGHDVWLSWNVVREGDLIYCSARDITREKQQREELEQAKERISRTQKMETIGQITGGVAHDFNNLLTIIIGNLEAAQHQLETWTDGSQIKLGRRLESAMRGAQRAATLTKRLLAFSRQQPLSPMILDVNRALGGGADLNEVLFGSERAALAVVRPALLDIQRGSASTVMHHLRERQPTSITSPRGLGIG